MSDYLLQCAASNWLVSSVLAAFAWFAQSKLRRPVIAHLLWLLVLVKLVTPPLFSLAVLPASAEQAAPLMANVIVNHAAAASAALVPEPVAAATMDATTVLLGLWLLGSVIVLIWSTFRIVRFHRLLTLASRPAPQDLTKRADQLAKTLGLKKTPSINITSARVTPMVWWVGGKVRVFIPEAMPAELGSNQMRWILAHELGHVRRRDHFVRWLEWLACVAFWWNPIAWLARRNLRANEEVCCDALVLRSLKGKPHSYANSLLAAVEFLASPGLRPPAMASEINSGGFLERRFRMIVSKTPIATTPRWLQAVLLVCTVAVMPLGLAYAQNPDVGAVTKRLRKAVQAGEVSPLEARKMLRALKESNTQDPRRSTSKRSEEQEHYNRLVKSAKDGLKEGLRSGKLNEERAQRLYERQMRHLEAGATKEATRALRTAQDKTHTQEAIKRAAELLERQSAVGTELDATKQRLRLVQNQLRHEEERIIHEVEKQDRTNRRALIRKELEESRRQLDVARMTLDKTHATQATALNEMEHLKRDKELLRAMNMAKQAEAIDKARRDLNKKAVLLRKMRANLAKEQAALEAATNNLKTQNLRVDWSKNHEKQDRIKEEKAKAKANQRRSWKTAIDLTNKQTGLAINKLQLIEYEKVKAEYKEALQLRASNFSRKRSDLLRDLNSENTIKAELEKAASEWPALKQRTDVELEQKLSDLEVNVDVNQQQHRAGNWRALLGSNKSKNLSEHGSNLNIRRLGVEKRHIAEDNRRILRSTILRSKERSIQLQREVDVLLDTQQQELINRRAVLLKRDMTARRATSKKKDLKTRAAELKSEMELRRAALEMAKDDAAKTRKETRRRSGIR